MLKKFETLLNKRSSWFVLFGFLLFSFWFNGNFFWSQLCFDSSTTGAIWGEVRVYEWLTNKFYESIASFQNPFGQYSGMLYPFQLQIGLTDAGNGLFYFLFRPFLSSYQSFMLIMALSQIAANVGMYLLMRKLQVSKLVSFIISLSFGYMTFLSVRQGHLNYFMIYVFPWFYFCVFNMLSARGRDLKIISSFGAATFLALSLWINFYYFIMIVTSISAFFVYFVAFHRQQLFRVLKERVGVTMVALSSLFIILIPWFRGVYEGIKFESIPRLSGWGGAIEFSADLFSFFVPSVYNHYIYNYLAIPYEAITKKHAAFAFGAFENFVYPGIIILVGLAFYGIFHFKKGFKDRVKSSYPYLFMTAVFFILTLGPFLHVLGRWGYYLDENIRLVIPMPYILFHYVPLFENIRVPGRLVVAFIFFAYITIAFVFDYIVAKKSAALRFFFLVILLLIFILDQRYVSALTPPDVDYPYHIYKVIQSDQSFSSVMEVPFTVRDGFTYFGDEEAVSGIVGESFHGRPIIGGYTGRIADYKRAYYYRNPLLGYLGRAMDENIANNPVVNKTDLINWKTLDYQGGRDVMDFLDIKYVIVDTKETYAEVIKKALVSFGYNKEMSDGRFELLIRPPIKREFLKIDFDSPSAVTYLGMGWQAKGSQLRLAEKKVSVMMKILKKRNMNLRFIVRVDRARSITLYVNRKLSGKLQLSPDKSNYNIEIGSKLEPGINEFHFFFDSTEEDRLTVAEFEIIELKEIN